MANFEAFEQFLTESTTTGPIRTLPGCVVAAVDKTGITYSHASGTQSANPESPLVAKPFSLDTTMWIASCTKLLTSLAALQCVERGLLTKDGDISQAHPDLAPLGKMKVLKGFNDDGSPNLIDNTKPITLTHLLSHSSGLGYAGFDPEIQAVYKHNNKRFDIITPTFFEDIFASALRFEPGASWTYGVGIDVAGYAVTKVTGLTLQQYFEKELFGPLKMTKTSFKLTPEIQAERADMAARGEDGNVVPSPMGAEQFLPKEEVDVQMGGAGLYSCARDYTKLLSALLQTPSPLFKEKETLEWAFQPCLTPQSRKGMNDILFGAFGAMFSGGALPTEGIEVDYSMAGLSVLGGLEGRRAGAGKAIQWGGLPNLLWCVDREKGKAVFYGSQILPPGDQKSGEAFAKFEALIFGGEGSKL